MSFNGGFFSGNLSTFSCRGEPIIPIKQQEELLKSIGNTIKKSLKDGANGYKHWTMSEPQTRLRLQESLRSVVWERSTKVEKRSNKCIRQISEKRSIRNGNVL